MAILAASSASIIHAQTDVTGSSMALKSSGANSGTSSWTLGSNGYVGTYITLANAGSVTLSLTAAGQADAGISPRMDVVVADSDASFSVASGTANYSTTLSLPAGTYFVRTQLDNADASRQLTIANLQVSGAAVSNSSTNANALSAANTYIDNFRQGPATVQLTGPGNIPLLAGTSVKVDMARNAFNFGGTVSGVTINDSKDMLTPNPAVGTEANQFQSFINQYFNTIVPSNAGKWASDEPTQNDVTMQLVDRQIAYAQAHNMNMRMHNLIWGSGSMSGNQQPSFVNTLIASAASGNSAAAGTLSTDIANRINYYAGTNGNRSDNYQEMDVLNEALNNPAYWNIYGAAGIANIYNEVAAAAKAAGNPNLRLYTNEYNVLQFSPSSISTAGVESGSDPYANWYRNEVEAIRNAGGALSGIGMEYYANVTQTSANAHSAAMIQKALQNLSVEGLPISMDEFGLATGTSSADTQSLGPQVMDDTVRMLYGNPQATTFMVWGWWDTSASIATNGAPPAQMIVTTPGASTYTLTALGQEWVNLMNEFSTHTTATVTAGATINFNGFYGNYNIGGQSVFSNMNLVKGTTQYSLALSAPPQWSFWNPASSGTWSAATNWSSGGVANSTGQTAYFGSASSPRTITVDTPQTVGMIAFNSSNQYTIGGVTIDLHGSAGQTAIYVASGSHEIDAPIVTQDNLTVTVAPSASTFTATQLQPTTAGITKSGSGAFAVNGIQAASLGITSGGLKILPNSTTASAANALSITGNIDAWAGQLDLSNNSLVINYTGTSPLGTIQNQIKSGADHGLWDGMGITSSAAQAIASQPSNPHKTALGFADSGSSIRIVYTLAGDANLDGVVNAADFDAIAANYGESSSTWTAGDFNYDGVINTADFNMLAENYNLSVLVAASGLGTLVPEPTTLSLFAVAFAASLKRKRKRLTRVGYLLAAAIAPIASAQTTSLTGSSLSMQSDNSNMLGSTGFVGTYLVVPTGGATVNFTINSTEGASGTGTPNMELTIADSTASFNINSTSATNYTTGNVTLPAGTYVVNDQRDYTGNVGVTRSFTVNNLSVSTVSGSAATFSNVDDGTTALTAADTYINNFRKGNASVALAGPGNIPLLAGTPVNVDMKRIDFDFGTAVPGSSPSGVNAYLGTNAQGVGTTTQQQQYQAHLLQNFNAVVPENMGKWANDEPTQGSTANMSGIDTILNFAQKNNMGARMHNLIWGSQQPSFATTLLSQAAAGSLTAQTTLRNDISSRIGYFVGTGTSSDRSTKYQQLDVYNESYHTGETVAGSYWNVYTPTGIANIYQQVHAVAPNVALFMNEYNVYEDGADKYASWYQQHIEEVRNAGIAAGYGDVIGGIGTQYYPDNTPSVYTNPNSPSVSGSAHDPARMMQTLQNLSTEGLPITLTEFGVKPPNAPGAGGGSMSTAAATEQSAASILSDSLRMVFGTPNATGFMMWGYQAEGNGTTFGTNLFQSESALYTVNSTGAGTQNWAANEWTLTPAGKVWQTQLGIQNWGVTGSDGTALQGWTTQLDGASAPVVNSSGAITYNGFYGDYNIGDQSGDSNLSMLKGTSQYGLNLAAPPMWSLWNPANSGTWSTSSNWSTGGVANAAGQTAYFGSAAAARSITVVGGETVGMIAFDSANEYTITGGSISLGGLAGISALYVATGSHEIDSPLSMLNNTNVTVVPSGGALTVTNLQPSSVTITKSGPGTFIANNIIAGGLNIAAGTVRTTTGGSAINALSIAGGTGAWTATLDLANTDLTVNYTGSSPLGVIQDQIKSAAANAAWTGMGITSSAAASVAADGTNPHKTALGFEDTGSSIFIRYTLAGDANLDGIVNAQDFDALAANYGTTGSTWVAGDFNYDGIVNGVDFNALAMNFNASLPQSAASLGALVPEPAGLMLGCAGSLSLIRRRRNGQHRCGI